MLIILLDSKLIIANNVLYAITPQGKELHICRLSPNDGVFLTMHRVPSPKLWASGEEVIETNLSDTEEDHNGIRWNCCRW